MSLILILSLFSSMSNWLVGDNENGAASVMYNVRDTRSQWQSEKKTRIDIEELAVDRVALSVVILIS